MQKCRKTTGGDRMNLTNKIALKRTIDPMRTVLDYLFDLNGKITISKGILEIMKRNHSYTMMFSDKKTVYTFYKRERGTESTIFSFTVTTEKDGNRVSDLEYTTELVMLEKKKRTEDAARAKNIYIIFEDETFA